MMTFVAGVETDHLNQHFDLFTLFESSSPRGTREHQDEDENGEI